MLGRRFLSVDDVVVNRVGSGRLVRIAKIFQVPVAALFEGIEDRRQPSSLIADRSAYRLGVAFAKVDDRRIRRSLVTLVERIAARK